MTDQQSPSGDGAKVHETSPTEVDGSDEVEGADGSDEAAEVDEAPVERPRGHDVVLAIDIGGTKFAAGLVTARGELIDRARVEVPKDAVPEQHWAGMGP